MKFKCIKDFWMHRESAENGDIPAFKEGEVYKFYVSKGIVTPEMYTPTDNHGAIHHMDLDDEFYDYFVEVE